MGYVVIIFFFKDMSKQVVCGLNEATSGQLLPTMLSRYRGCVQSDVPHLNHAALSAAAPRKRHKSESLELQLLAAHVASNLWLSRVQCSSRNPRDNRSRQLPCYSGDFYFIKIKKNKNKNGKKS